MKVVYNFNYTNCKGALQESLQKRLVHWRTYTRPISKWDINASPPAYKRAVTVDHVTRCCFESLSIISPRPILSIRLATSRRFTD
jgi:hypothetical protein